MGCVQSKKEGVILKNNLPKENEISKVAGEIVLKKDSDFNILCFDVNFDGYYTTRVRLWPENHPTTPPPMPDVSSIDSGIDIQKFFLAKEKYDPDNCLCLYKE